MQHPSSARPLPPPTRPLPPPSLVPKPADRPGGIWLLTLHTPGGCAPNVGPGPHLAVCTPREPVYSWVFQRGGLSFGRL